MCIVSGGKLVAKMFQSVQLLMTINKVHRSITHLPPKFFAAKSKTDAIISTKFEIAMVVSSNIFHNLFKQFGLIGMPQAAVSMENSILTNVSWHCTRV